ncbi:MAG: CDP-2,3-bis-(O-geranylgeranyl)-sn-glycerol synthase [Candidatus Bathyarchaeia archaeon]|jgi:CDP-2,3-bis-(O-geranylgeranyl)-sn-glycerol synthase|nr:CDP-2,3-bis-(O-geranylgeranyl)-sn-glycerol synthase [Candidatus Bathyarchaeota archaeon A05DMB-4]MDH7595240.1 CDP-2,3-bis-(O-geranylgeranyl)-sn-glycerol synthase [Candidatus Bathyarchaeota archaeon]
MFGNPLLDALVFIFPAYCANAVPVIFGGGLPIDGGRLFRDGKPIFGAHKTWRGLVSGLVVGTLVGFGLSLLIEYSVLLGFVISLGALLGDLAEAFFKRRLGFAPGASFPVADQLDFVVGALVFSLFVSPPTLLVALIVLVITPPIHLLTNLLAYVVGVKKEPW